MGVFPGRDTRCAESGCFPSDIGGARKTGVPPHKSIYYVLDDYCINST